MKETQIVQQPDRESVEFIPFGAEESIKLTLTVIREIIAVPTRSGKLPERRDCIKFMMLCRARHLDPFGGDAYLLGYDTQSGPQFSLITAHQVFLKRAEASVQFDAMESGVIVLGEPLEKGLIGMVHEREGDFTFKGETLLGGWAKVYRKDRSKPFYRRLKLETFSTGQSRWAKDPAGMIVKCAEADALRSAFPTHLGGLYLKEENVERMISGTVTDSKTPAAPKFVPAIEEHSAEEPTTEKPSKDEKPKAEKKPKVEPSPAQEVAKLMAESGVTPDALFDYIRSQDQGDYADLAELPDGLLRQTILSWPFIAESIQKETKWVSSESSP